MLTPEQLQQRLEQAQDQGFADYFAGSHRNRYPEGSRRAAAWLDGWRVAADIEPYLPPHASELQAESVRHQLAAEAQRSFMRELRAALQPQPREPQ